SRLPPIHHHRKQTDQARVVARACPAPMHGLIHVAAIQGVVVCIFQFLSHDFFAWDLFWVTTRMPELEQEEGARAYWPITPRLIGQSPAPLSAHHPRPYGRGSP